MNLPYWYKQSGFRFEHLKRVIYIDPWDIPEGEPPADFILITHSHFDHFDLPTVLRLRKDSTIMIAPFDVAQKLPGSSSVVIAPGEHRDFDDFSIETLPAYNISKDFHPKESKWVGYILTANGVRYYHAGDTDAIPEMREINADVALLPIGGTYTMNVDEAVEAAKMLRAKTIIPMHYGFIVGSRDDGKCLKKLLPGSVELLTPHLPFTL